MMTKFSLPAANSHTASGGVSLDTPASTATATKPGNADFNTAMSKANDDAKAPASPHKSAKATKSTAAAPTTVAAAPAKTATTDAKKVTLANLSSAALMELVEKTSIVLTTSPVKMDVDGTNIGKNSDDVQTDSDSKKKNDSENNSLTTTTSIRTSDMDVSTTSVLLAMLGQTSTAKDLRRLVPLTGSGSLSDDSKSDGDCAPISASETQTTASTVTDKASSTSLVGIVPDTKLKTVVPPTISPIIVKTDDKNSKSSKVETTTPAATTNQTASSAADAANSTPPIKMVTGPKAAQIALQPVDPSITSATPVSQAFVNQVNALQLKEVNTVISTDGTGVASSSQRMKFAAEKNEIAGRGVQNVPTAAAGDAVLPNTAVHAAAGANANSSGAKKESSDSPATIDISSALPTLSTAAAKTTENLVPTTQAANQAERVGHLINQEVVMIRQSGANSLAVSLKVDPHTELFLQLTNHNGQVQASISCERGNIAGLGSHWNDLQESLAKQNVQLMPLEDKSAVRPLTASAVTSPASTGSSNFNQSSQNSTRQNRTVDNDFTLDPAATKTRTGTKTKTKTSSSQGWESWA